MQPAVQKTKMVSFRLSAEEYDRLRAACSTVGIENLSELARIAMHKLIDSPPRQRAVAAAQIRLLRNRIDELSAEIERLSRLVTTDD